MLQEFAWKCCNSDHLLIWKQLITEKLSVYKICFLTLSLYSNYAALGHFLEVLLGWLQTV